MIVGDTLFEKNWLSSCRALLAGVDMQSGSRSLVKRGDFMFSLNKTLHWEQSTAYS